MEDCFSPVKLRDFDIDQSPFMSRKTASFDSYFESLQSTNLKRENDQNDFSYQVHSY